MKSAVPQKAGVAQNLAPDRDSRLPITLLLVALLACGVAAAESMYKYRGQDGEWIFSDRPPDDGQEAEIRTIARRATQGGVTVTHSFTGSSIEFTARNRSYAPMEIGLEISDIVGVEYPHPDQELRWIVPARSNRVLLNLPVLTGADARSVDYRYVYLPGDPGARPSADTTYRVPFSVGTYFPVTQTYPDSATHRTRDSMYAVDIAMPVGTDVVAARDGIVFDVASTNFKGGPDADEYAKLANLIRVLHDDGTYAVYAHLNWNTIRVNPGDRVRAGQYIADSGNTGFSSGPHLHFAVQRNMGMRIDSLPVEFRGTSGMSVAAATGDTLTAHP